MKTFLPSVLPLAKHAVWGCRNRLPQTMLWLWPETAALHIKSPKAGSGSQLSLEFGMRCQNCDQCHSTICNACEWDIFLADEGGWWDKKHAFWNPCFTIKEPFLLVSTVRQHGNRLLCTLLLGNVVVNSALSILLSDLTSGLVGLAVSTIVILILGEHLQGKLCHTLDYYHK